MSIKMNGLEDTLKMVERYTKSLRTMKPLFEKIEEELENEVDNAIKNQKSATTGKKYKELSEITMEKTGKSKNQALYSGGKTAKIVKIDNISEHGATISVSMPYAEIQQFGNPDNKYYESKAPVPSRSFLPITKDKKFTKKFQNKISKIVQEWLQEKLNRRGI